jgi:hypothetical protein
VRLPSTCAVAGATSKRPATTSAGISARMTNDGILNGEILNDELLNDDGSPQSE